MKLNPLALFDIGNKYKITTFFVLLFITVVLSMGIPKLKIDTSLDSLVPDGHPMKLDLDEVTENFGSSDTTILYFKHPRLFSPEPLKKLEDTHYYFEDHESVEKVESLFTSKSIRDQDGDLSSESILFEAPEDEETIAKAKADTLYSPFLRGNFINDDATVTAVNITTVSNFKDMEEVKAFYDDVQSRIAELDDEYDAFQVGNPRIRNDLKTLLIEDMKVLLPVSLASLCIMLAILLRRASGIFLPLISSLLSISWTFGLMGWLGMPINILSAMLPTLLIVMGTTEDVHLFAGYLEGLKKQKVPPFDKREAVSFMVHHVGIPIFIAITTTLVGFMSNALSSVQFIQSFAYASTIGIALNGFITVLVCPLFLSLFGSRTVPGSSHDDEETCSRFDRVADCLASWTFKYPKEILAGTLIIVLIFIAYATKLTVNNDPLSYFRSDNPLIQEVDQVTEDLAGMQTVFITVKAKEDNAFLEPENLEKLLKISRYIKSMPKFDVAISFADQLALVNREMNGADPEAFTVPATRDLVEQYLLFFQPNELRTYITSDFKYANIVVRHHIRNSTEMIDTMEVLESAAQEIAGDDLQIMMASRNYLINKAADTLIKDMLILLPLVVFVIMIIIALFFTNISAGLLSLIPNLLPLIGIFGFMGMFNIPINPATSLVALIGLGIAVDDTVHLFITYIQYRRTESDKYETMRKTLRAEVLPVLTTSFSLAIGFGVLMLSNFTIVIQFGMLSAVAIMLAVLSDLIVTPTLISQVKMVSFFDIMSLELQKEVTQKSPLFYDMTPYQIRKAILLCHAESYKEDEAIIKIGQVERKMYMVLTGEVKVTLPTENDGEKLVTTLGPGEIFGEIAYLHEVERTANVTATQNTELMTFNHQTLTRNSRRMPRIMIKMFTNITRILSKRLADANQQQMQQG